MSHVSAPGVQVRELTPDDEAFVGSCTHVGETDEWDASCRRRVHWLRKMCQQGLSIKVALLEGQHAGFLYLFPIETAPVELCGRGLSVIQCLAVRNELHGRGVGRSLLAAAEAESRRRGRKGIAVIAFCHDFWFMPAPFFERHGYTVVERHGATALMWVRTHDDAESPRLLQRRYRFAPLPDAVAVDLFWSHACLTTDTEAQRVREVAAEFGDAVRLREHCVDEPGMRARYGICRAILIDGQEVSWGYEAPREGLRDAIRRAVAARS